MDGVAPGIGEIIDGSDCAEQLAVLDARMAERGIDCGNNTPGTRSALLRHDAAPA